MSLVDTATVAAYCGVAVDDATLLLLHPSVELQVQSILNRTLAATTYYNERYDGSGINSQVLNQYPIIEVYKVSSNTATAFTIQSTSSDASATIAFVDSDNSLFKLKTVGGANEHAWEEFAFATYPTFTLLIAAINTFASGWTATISSSAVAAFPVEELLRQSFDDCYAAAQDIAYPSNFLNVLVDHEAGIIRRYMSASFTKGSQNLIVSYKAGYSSLPADLVYVICQMVNNLIIRHADSMSDGLRRYTLGDITKEWYQEVTRNPEINMILSKYKRRLFV